MVISGLLMVSRLWQIEESLTRPANGRSEVFQGHVMDFGELSCGVDEHRRLAGAFVAHRFRRDVGAVGLNHHPVQGYEFCRGPDVVGLPKGHNSGEGQVIAFLQQHFSLLTRSAVAVKHNIFEPAGEFVKDCQRLIEGVSTMNDDGQIEFFCDPQLRAEDMFLGILL